MLFLSPALAGTLVGAVGTGDLAVGQSILGAEVAVLGEQTMGFRPHFRLLAGYDLFQTLPSGSTELGFTGVVPNDEATIRAGLFFRADHLLKRRRIAFQVGQPDEGDARYGLAIGGAAMVELAWNPDAPLVLGGHLGMGHWSSVDPNCVVGPDGPVEGFPERCDAWPVSIIGAAYLRKSLKNGLTFRVQAGTTFEVGVGYRIK